VPLGLLGLLVLAETEVTVVTVGHPKCLALVFCYLPVLAVAAHGANPQTLPQAVVVVVLEPLVQLGKTQTAEE